MITEEELEHFKNGLLQALRELLSEKVTNCQVIPKPWYKAAEVKKLLGISSGKLQLLRIKGQLRSSKIGGVHYYRSEDIDAMFQQKKCDGLKDIRND